MVSHDRYFLNRLVDHIWELERTVLTTYRGNYSSYVVQKKERVERQLKEYEMQQEQIKSMEEYVAKRKIPSGGAGADGPHRKAGHLGEEGCLPL